MVPSRTAIVRFFLIRSRRAYFTVALTDLVEYRSGHMFNIEKLARRSSALVKGEKGLLVHGGTMEPTTR